MYAPASYSGYGYSQYENGVLKFGVAGGGVVSTGDIVFGSGATYDVLVNSLKLRQASGQLRPEDILATNALLAK